MINLEEVRKLCPDFNVKVYGAWGKPIVEAEQNNVSKTFRLDSDMHEEQVATRIKMEFEPL